MNTAFANHFRTIGSFGGRERLSNTVRAFFSAPSGVFALVVIGVLVLVSIFAPPILGEKATALNVAAGSQGPSHAHWLGTDSLGRDILARTLVATRLSLSLAILATLVAALLGIPFGGLTGLSPKRIRAVGTRLIDAVLGIPSILMGVFVATIVGPSAKAEVLGIGIAFAPQFARLVNTMAASVAGEDYVDSARIVGIKLPRLLRRHILPNIAESVVIVTFVAIADSIVAISSLSFLGLGVQAPRYDWGGMLTQGIQSFYLTPAAALAPAVMIAFAGLSTGLFGEASARAMNPRLWHRTASTTVSPPARREPLRAVNQTAPPRLADDGAILAVESLSVEFPTEGGDLVPVREVSMRIHQGESVGLVGESGSGKSLTALAIAKLVPYPGRVIANELRFVDVDLTGDDSDHVRTLLGTKLALVFQDPMSSFNPALRIRTQLIEASRKHRHVSRSRATHEAIQHLEEVGIAGARRRIRQYPHELSGGMRQRVMIAMALMMKPALIIADEPTTALDVTIQSQIMDLLAEINQSHQTALLLISHDLALVAERCTRVLVMYGGRIVEELSSEQLHAAGHPYTRALIKSVPSLSAARGQPLTSIPGSPPDPANMPNGCSFAPRCPFASDQCEQRPELREMSDGHRVACWHAEEVIQSGDPI